jgi:uncharacterized protein YecE (DUF72 family)
VKPTRIGCSGWNYDDWRGTFYPKGVPQPSWLEHYAKTFSTVEINATFYRLPTEKTVRTWAGSTPAGFCFAVKTSRYMTHVYRLKEPKKGGTGLFFEKLEPLREAGKLGPVLWQLPENFKRDDERLAGALRRAPAGRHAFEFRHESWFTEDVYALLREHGAALVVSDHPKWPFQTRELTTDWTYVRLHYGRRGRGGNYSGSEIATWKRRIAAWRSRVDVYAYLNNDWKAYAVRNAEALQSGSRRPTTSA